MPQGRPQDYITPPINPNAGSAIDNISTGDPFAGLTQLLQQLQTQTYQPPQQGTLQTILNSLAQGASVLASPDPGGQLGNILQGRQQLQMQQQQMQQQQQNQLMVAAIQGALEKARGIQSEQQDIRKEARQEKALDLAANRQIETTKAIDLNKLDIQMKEAEQNQILLSKFEPDENRRARFKAGLQALPQQMQESLKMQTMMQTLLPEMPSEVAKSIADKQTGLAPRNFNSVENQWYSKFSQIRNNQYKEDKDLERRVKESEITENEAQALYYQNSKIQDRYGNALQTNLGNAVADAVDTNYFRVYSGTPQERIVSQKELQGVMSSLLGSVQAKPQPLSPQETQMEQQKRIKNLQTFREQVSQPQATTMPGQPTVGNPANDDPILKQMRTDAQSGKTREQIINNLLNSGLPSEVIHKYVKIATDQYNSLKGQMTPATQKKKKTPAGVNVQDILNLKK